MSHYNSLVLDAGPLLTQTFADLQSKADKFYSTPSVIAEIRDERARLNLEAWNGTLIVKRPSAEHMNKVVEFAKKTGDYAVLSNTDLEIIALCRQVDVELHSGSASHLRVQPLKVINAEGAKPKAQGISFSEFEQLQQEEPSAEEDEWATVTTSKRRGRGNRSNNKEQQPKNTENTETNNTLESQFAEKVSLEEPKNDVPVVEETETVAAKDNAGEDNEENDDDEDDWITPENIKEVDIEEAEDNEEIGDENGELPCAISTVDFACQNVALQMGLNLVSIEGRRVKTVKNFMLRCYACFAMIPVPIDGRPKHFCPSCGSNTLLRCSVSVNSKGELTAHLKKRMQWSTRGNKFALPSPYSKKTASAPRHNASSIILREDERAYEKAMSSSMRKKRQNAKTLDEWTGSGSADNVMNPFAFAGYNRDISRNTDVHVGQGRYVNSARKKV